MNFVRDIAFVICENLDFSLSFTGFGVASTHQRVCRSFNRAGLSHMPAAGDLDKDELLRGCQTFGPWSLVGAGIFSNSSREDM